MAQSANEVNEHELLTLDLSGSYDSDGEIVRFEVAVDEGREEYAAFPFATDAVSKVDEGIFTVRAPEVIVGGTRCFKHVSVEIEDDRGAVVREEVEFEVIDVLDADKSLGFTLWRIHELDRPVKLLSSTPLYGSDVLAAIDLASPHLDGSERLIGLGDPYRSATDLSLMSGAVIQTGVRSVDKFLTSVPHFNLQPGPRSHFSVLDKNNNRIHWFADLGYDGGTLDYIDEVQIPIDNPCEVRERTDTGQNIILVGQEDHGLSVVRIDPIRPLDFLHQGFDWNYVSSTSSGRSLCTILETQLPISYSDYAGVSQLDDLIALDHAAKEIVLLADDELPAEVYEELASIPLETGGDPNMSIIDTAVVGSPSLVPRFIFVLMSDGRENGNHRIILISEEYTDTPGNHDIVQKTIDFTGPAPDKMLLSSFLSNESTTGIDYGADLAVISFEAGHVLIFEDEAAEVSSRLFDTPQYKEPILIRAKPGINSAIVVVQPLLLNSSKTPIGSIMLSYPELNQLHHLAYLR